MGQVTDFKSQCYTPGSLRNAVERLPRKCLQGLAKQYGIKANQKSADIINTLYPKLLVETSSAADDGADLDAHKREQQQGPSTNAAELSPMSQGAAGYAPQGAQATPPARASPTPPADLFRNTPINPLFCLSNDSIAEAVAALKAVPVEQKEAHTEPAVPVGGQPAAAGTSPAAQAGGTAVRRGEAEQAQMAEGLSENSRAATALPVEKHMAEEALVEQVPAAAAAPAAAPEQPAGAVQASMPEPAAVRPHASQPNMADEPPRRRASAATGRRSSVAVDKAWQDQKLQELEKLQKNWSSFSSSVGTGKAHSWKLPSAKAVKQTASSLARSGFTVVNSPGKNRQRAAAQAQAAPASGIKRKAEAAPGQTQQHKAARGSSVLPAGGHAGSTSSRLCAISGPAASSHTKENTAGLNVPLAKAVGVAAKSTGGGASKLPAAANPLASASMADRAKKAEAAFTARRAAALQKVIGAGASLLPKP